MLTLACAVLALILAVDVGADVLRHRIDLEQRRAARVRARHQHRRNQQ